MAKPYYEDKYVTIYHGDSADVLREVSGDIAVTSPPYNTLPLTNKVTGMRKSRPRWTNAAYASYADAKPEDEYQTWLREIIGLCMTSVEGLVWVNHKIRYRDGVAIHPVRFLPFDIYVEIIWDGNQRMAFNCKRYVPSHEGIWGFGKPHYWSDELNIASSIWRIPQAINDNDGHPCAYPDLIPRRLITSSCPPGGVVIDPFMGSGTTLRAAKDLGVRAIGIEIEERYCEIAARRMAQGALEFEPVREPEQMSIAL